MTTYEAAFRMVPAQESAVLLLASPEPRATRCHSFLIRQVKFWEWYKTWHQLNLPSSQSPRCLSTHEFISELNTRPPVQSMGPCDAGVGVTTLRSTSAPVPWVPWRERIRSILHARSVRPVHGLWARSLLRLRRTHQPVLVPLQLPANLCYKSAYRRSACSAFFLQNRAVTVLLDKKDPTPFSKLCSLPSLLCSSKGELRQTKPHSTSTLSLWSPSGVLRHPFILLKVTSS